MYSQFKDAYLMKYYPLVGKLKNYVAFLEPYFGNKTTKEYNIVPNRLARFAPELVNTEKMNLDGFILGL